MKYIVDFVKNTPLTQVDEFLTDNDCRVIQHMPNMGHVYLVESSESPTSSEIVANVIAETEHDIQLLNTDRIVYPSREDDWWKVAVIRRSHLDGDQSSIINAGSSVKLYLLDSGISASHEEFSEANINLLHSINDNFDDTTGHGTALASVIVGKTCGICDAELHVVKIFDKSQTTTIPDILSAFNAVLGDFLKSPHQPAVMNLSWTVGKNDYLNEKIRDMIDLGVIVICAAGNSGIEVTDVTPAGIQEAITVGSFSPDLEPSDFSNYSKSDTSLTQGMNNSGIGLDIFAPGENIRVALASGAYGISAGTSIASAIMGATAAINIAHYGVTYKEMGPTDFIDELKHRMIIRDMLTLEGKYAASPNAIPGVRLRASEVDEMPHINDWSVWTSGETISAWVFNPNFFSLKSVNGLPSWVTIEGNWIKGTAPDKIPQDANGFQKFAITLDLIDQQQKIKTVEYTVVLYDAASFATAKELGRKLDLEFLGTGPCGCPSTQGVRCCAQCNNKAGNTSCVGDCSSSAGICP